MSGFKRPARLESMRFALALSLLGAVGCTKSVEQSTVHVNVSVDADSDVRRRVLDVQVLLGMQHAAASSFQVRAERRYTPNTGHSWPLEFREEPEIDDYGGSYQLTATGRSAEGAVVAQARVIAKLERGRDLVLEARFEASCFNRSSLCPSHETCSGGTCVSASEDPYGERQVGVADADQSAGGGGLEPSASGLAHAAAACATEDARACSGPASRTPLLCQDEVWRVEPECAEDERCDTARGPTQGTCREIADECMSMLPNVPFCAGESILVCADLVSFVQRGCGEHERCETVGDSARCSCKPGFIVDPGNNGACVEATRPCRDDGGCDP